MPKLNSLTPGHGPRSVSQGALSAQRPSSMEAAPPWAILNEFVMPISGLSDLGFDESAGRRLATGYQQLLSAPLYAYLPTDGAKPNSQDAYFGLTLGRFIDALGQALRASPYLADIELSQLYWDDLMPILQGRATSGSTQVRLTLFDRHAMQPMHREEWNLRLIALMEAVRSACQDPHDVVLEPCDNYAIACHRVEEVQTRVVEMPLHHGDSTTQRVVVPVQSTREVIYALPRIERQGEFRFVEGDPEWRGHGSVIFNVIHATDRSYAIQIQLGLPAPTLAVDALAFGPLPDPSIGPCLLSEAIPVERALAAAMCREIVLCPGASTKPHTLALAIRSTLGGCRVSDEVKAELIDAYKAYGPAGGAALLNALAATGTMTLPLLWQAVTIDPTLLQNGQFRAYVGTLSASEERASLVNTCLEGLLHLDSQKAASVVALLGLLLHGCELGGSRFTDWTYPNASRDILLDGATTLRDHAGLLISLISKLGLEGTQKRLQLASLLRKDLDPIELSDAILVLMLFPVQQCSGWPTPLPIEVQERAMLTLLLQDSDDRKLAAKQLYELSPFYRNAFEVRVGLLQRGDALTAIDSQEAVAWSPDEKGRYLLTGAAYLTELAIHPNRFGRWSELVFERWSELVPLGLDQITPETLGAFVQNHWDCFLQLWETMSTDQQCTVAQRLTSRSLDPQDADHTQWLIPGWSHPDHRDSTWIGLLEVLTAKLRPGLSQPAAEPLSMTAVEEAPCLVDAAAQLDESHVVVNIPEQPAERSAPEQPPVSGLVAEEVDVKVRPAPMQEESSSTSAPSVGTIGTPQPGSKKKKKKQQQPVDSTSSLSTALASGVTGSKPLTIPKNASLEQLVGLYARSANQNSDVTAIAKALLQGLDSWDDSKDDEFEILLNSQPEACQAIFVKAFSQASLPKKRQLLDVVSNDLLGAGPARAQIMREIYEAHQDSPLGIEAAWEWLIKSEWQDSHLETCRRLWTPPLDKHLHDTPGKMFRFVSLGGISEPVRALVLTEFFLTIDELSTERDLETLLGRLSTTVGSTFIALHARGSPSLCTRLVKVVKGGPLKKAVEKDFGDQLRALSSRGNVPDTIYGNRVLEMLTLLKLLDSDEVPKWLHAVLNHRPHSLPKLLKPLALGWAKLWLLPHKLKIACQKPLTQPKPEDTTVEWKERADTFALALLEQSDLLLSACRVAVRSKQLDDSAVDLWASTIVKALHHCVNQEFPREKIPRQHELLFRMLEELNYQQDSTSRATGMMMCCEAGFMVAQTFHDIALFQQLVLRLGEVPYWRTQPIQKPLGTQLTLDAALDLIAHAKRLMELTGKPVFPSDDAIGVKASLGVIKAFFSELEYYQTVCQAIDQNKPWRYPAEREQLDKKIYDYITSLRNNKSLQNQMTDFNCKSSSNYEFLTYMHDYFTQFMTTVAPQINPFQAKSTTSEGPLQLSADPQISGGTAVQQHVMNGSIDQEQPFDVHGVIGSSSELLGSASGHLLMYLAERATLEGQAASNLLVQRTVEEPESQPSRLTRLTHGLALLAHGLGGESLNMEAFARLCTGSVSRNSARICAPAQRAFGLLENAELLLLVGAMVQGGERSSSPTHLIGPVTLHSSAAAIDVAQSVLAKMKISLKGLATGLDPVIEKISIHPLALSCWANSMIIAYDTCAQHGVSLDQLPSLRNLTERLLNSFVTDSLDTEMNARIAGVSDCLRVAVAGAEACQDCAWFREAMTALHRIPQSRELENPATTQVSLLTCIEILARARGLLEALHCPSSDLLPHEETTKAHLQRMFDEFDYFYRRHGVSNPNGSPRFLPDRMMYDMEMDGVIPTIYERVIRRDSGNARPQSAVRMADMVVALQCHFYDIVVTDFHLGQEFHGRPRLGHP